MIRINQNKTTITKDITNPCEGFVSEVYLMDSGIPARARVKRFLLDPENAIIRVQVVREELDSLASNVVNSIDCTYDIKDKPEISRIQGEDGSQELVIIQEYSDDFTQYVKMLVSSMNNSEHYNELQDIFSVNTKERALVETGLKDLPLFNQ
ncbi:MAG: hypothetical protein ACPGSO_00640 [Vicingaceae bacterium]